MYIVLFLLWIIFNGKFTVEIAVFGAVISGAIEWFMIRYLNYKPKISLEIFKTLYRVVQYVFVLVAEIAKANIQVIRMILNLKAEVEPQIIHFKTNLKSDVLKTALANSITLTPGTITVKLEEDQYTVLCLDKEFAEGIEDSVFVKMLEKMEE